MKHLLTVLFIAGAVLFSDALMAQDGGKKDKKKKKKKTESEAVDTMSVPTSGSGPQEITIDEAGTSKSQTASPNRTDSTSTNAPPAGLGRPDEPEPEEEPKEEPEESGEAAEAQKSGSFEESPAPPPGAGSLQGGQGTQITIDEAGSERTKNPVETVSGAMQGGASPTNLTIDEAGTEKKKEVKGPANLDNTEKSDSTSTTTTTTTVQDQVKEEVKEEVKDRATEKAKEESKEAGKKALEFIKPKN